MSQWYYVHDKQRCGPVSTEELRALLLQGTVQPGTLVWDIRVPTWLPLSKALPEMVRTTPAGPAHAPVPAALAASAPVTRPAPRPAAAADAPAPPPLMEDEEKKGCGCGCSAGTVMLLAVFTVLVLSIMGYGGYLHVVNSGAVAAAESLLQKAQVPPDMMPASVGGRYLAGVDSPGPQPAQMQTQETLAVVRAHYVKYMNPFGGEIQVEARRFASGAEAGAQCQEYRDRHLHPGTEDMGVYYADQKSPSGIPLPTDGTTCTWARGDTFYIITAHYSVRDELRSFAVLYLGSTSAAPSIPASSPGR